MALGNLNNLIAFRTKDLATQEFITETFGKTSIHEVNVSYGTRFDDHLPDFSAGFSRALSSSREDIVPTEVLVRLPDLQYLSSVAGGRLFKGRVDYAKGEPENMLTEAELVHKFRYLVADLLPAEQIRRIEAAAGSFEALEDVGSLVRLTYMAS